MSMPKNHRLFDSIINFRTFSGLKTKENAAVNGDKLYRSATFDFGTEADYAKLESLQIDLFIDFRGQPEKPSKERERFDQRFNRQSLPIDLGDFFSPERVRALREYELKSADSLFLELYEEFPRRYRATYQKLFQQLAKGGRIAFHCSAGKDRTGMASYLLLSALGVHYDDIVANYLESNLYVDQLVELFAPEIERSGISRERYREMQLVKPEYLEASRKAIIASYGSMEHFLTDGLGVDLDQLQHHYLY